MDQGPDMDQGPPPPPCTGATTEAAYPGWTDLTVCMSTVFHTQADAAKLCASGWHMCTATQYLARGGTKYVLTNQGPLYWLAACVKPGSPPQDGVCTNPQTGCPGGCAVGWSCVNGGSGITRTGHDRYAIEAHTYCYRLGTNTATGAYWWALSPNLSSTIPAGAVCCKD